jgi:hypothetical protein
MIIGICGLIGSGKDTIADHLVNTHEFRRESFANTLKDAVSSVFGWDREMLEGRSKQSREWRERVDVWWANRLGIPTLTPRWVLQYWGTEVCRRGFHDDVWIASLENKLRNSQDNIVISDCRFPNEIASIKNAGGKIICVVRGPAPDWYQDALVVNQGPEHNIGWTSARDRMKRLNIHASETAWVGTMFDAVVDNNGLVSQLYTQTNDLVKDLQGAKAVLA